MVNILKSGFHWSAFGNQQGSTFTKTNHNGFIHYIGCLITLSDRNGPILVLVTDFDHTGCLITLSDPNGPIFDLVYPILTIFLTWFQPILADLITKSDKAVRAVHSCKCWLDQPLWGSMPHHFHFAQPVLKFTALTLLEHSFPASLP